MLEDIDRDIVMKYYNRCTTIVKPALFYIIVDRLPVYIKDNCIPYEFQSPEVQYKISRGWIREIRQRIPVRYIAINKYPITAREFYLMYTQKLWYKSCYVIGARRKRVRYY